MLNFAQSQLVGEYYAAVERVRETTIEASPERKVLLVSINYPSKKDIIVLAEELKTFIDNK